MYVSQHARSQLSRRHDVADATIDRLESLPGAIGRHAIILQDVARATIGESAGDLIVAVVEDGEVITIMRRNAYQALSPRTLMVQSVTDIRVNPLTT